ncbi:MAG: hypothetical protein JWR69_1531, partial [Pedosphaera sp.]|nr:hypothetical protein [Pedosphaera sp.]
NSATVTKIETTANQALGLAGLVAPQFAPELALAGAILEGVEKIVIPTIQKLAQSGTVTPEVQLALKARIDSIRQQIADETLFSGPEWQVRQ